MLVVIGALLVIGQLIVSARTLVMKHSIKFLATWLIVAFMVSGLFVQPTPPGGVAWPYHIIVASIPLAAFLCARYTARVTLIVCFGLIAGFLTSWPYFTDGRTHLGIAYGLVTSESIGYKMGGFILLMLLICTGAFAVGRRVFKPYGFHAG